MQASRKPAGKQPARQPTSQKAIQEKIDKGQPALNKNLSTQTPCLGLSGGRNRGPAAPRTENTAAGLSVGVFLVAFLNCADGFCFCNAMKLQLAFPTLCANSAAKRAPFSCHDEMELHFRRFVLSRGSARMSNTSFAILLARTEARKGNSSCPIRISTTLDRSPCLPQFGPAAGTAHPAARPLHLLR